MSSPVYTDGTLVAEIARLWVEDISRQLIGTGRRIEGGWPGTISEARRRLAIRLGASAGRVLQAEFECLVKAVYQQAKQRWLDVVGANHRRNELVVANDTEE